MDTGRTGFDWRLKMRLSLVFLFCLIASNTLSQETATTATKIPYVEREEKQFQFYPGGKIDITSVVPGDIRIIGWKKGSVRIEAEKIAYYHSPEDAKILFETFPIRASYTQTSSKILIEGTLPAGTTIEYNLTIYVPGDRMDIKTTVDQGSIALESVNGWIEVTTGQGNLEISSLSGYFSGSTKKGDIHARMSGKRWRGLEFGAMTQTGSIDLMLPEDYSAKLQLETLYGKVVVDYPPNIVNGEPVPFVVGIRKNAQALETKIGTGGSPVKLISQAGDIRLSRTE
jgi:DUF4097 and DUF4098 domain-containing protein YvlB